MPIIDLRTAVTKNHSIMNAMVELLERNAYRLPGSSREVTCNGEITGSN